MAKLTILSCEPGDEGVYSCVVRTTHGEAESKASLKVHSKWLEIQQGCSRHDLHSTCAVLSAVDVLRVVAENTENLPPKVMLPLVDKTAIEGKSVTLECCISSDGTLQVEWYKGESSFGLLVVLAFSFCGFSVFFLERRNPYFPRVRRLFCAQTGVAWRRRVGSRRCTTGRWRS